MSRWQPLRQVYPATYEAVLTIFQDAGLQPYDFMADVGRTLAPSWLLRVRYGEGYLNEAVLETSDEGLNDIEQQVVAFVKDVVNACQETAVKDYRNFMRTNA